MKKLLAFVLSCTIWYGIISFIIWNLSIPEWHWVAKMLYIIFTLLTYQRVVEKQQSVYMYIRMKEYDVWCGRQKNILQNGSTMGSFGFDKRLSSLKCRPCQHWKHDNHLCTITNAEVSNFSYEDAIAFVSNEYAVAAQSCPYHSWVLIRSERQSTSRWLSKQEWDLLVVRLTIVKN